MKISFGVSEPRSGERLHASGFSSFTSVCPLSGVLGNVPKLHKRTLLLHLRHSKRGIIRGVAAE
jgi:hypothetical protein